MKILSSLILTAVSLPVALLSYAYIETNILMVHKKTHSTSKIKSGATLKIAHFTDMHLRDNLSVSMLNKCAKAINKHKPDMVFFTGDLFDKGEKDYPLDLELVSKMLKKIKAPMGKYAVLGNHEYRHGLVKCFRDVMSSADFKVLCNESAKCGNISIIGVDDLYMGSGDVIKSFRNIHQDSFNIALCHVPGLSGEIFSLGADMLFSGHSHWGQVNVPILKDIVLPPLCGESHTGEYKWGDKLLYVGSGVGTASLPIRFMAMPSVVIYEIKGK